MSEVKRLEMDHKGLPFVDDNGVYVLYEDYANLKEQFNFKRNLTEQVVALQKQCDALAAENAAVRASIPEERFIDIFNENMDDVSLAEDIGYNTAVKEMRRDIENPATDAYLNSVRADAVNHAGKMVIAMMNHQDKGVERALECIAEVELQYTLSAQLRAGEPS